MRKDFLREIQTIFFMIKIQNSTAKKHCQPDLNLESSDIQGSNLGNDSVFFTRYMEFDV